MKTFCASISGIAGTRHSRGPSGSTGPALPAVAALVLALGLALPAIAAANANFVGTWNPSNHQPWTVASQEAGGACTGRTSLAGFRFTACQVNGNEYKFDVDQEGTSYESHNRGTIEGNRLTGEFSDTNGSHSTYTAVRAGGSKTGTPGTANEPPSSFVLCVPSDCSGLSLVFPTTLSPATPITLSVACGAEAARASRHSGPVAIAAEGPSCQRAAFLRNLTTMARITVQQHPEPSSPYSVQQAREIKQALADLSTTDPNTAVQSAARKLSNDPTLTPNAQTTGDVEALLQALGHAAEGGEGDPGLIEVDGSLAGGFTESSASEAAVASSLAADPRTGARAASVSHLNTAAALAALIARHPKAADGQAFSQAVALASAPQPTAARGAARLTLALGFALAVRLSSHTWHGHRSAAIGSATVRRPKHARTTVTIHPTVEGQRLLRELEIAGLSQPQHVSVELSVRVGRGRVHRSTRSVRVI